MYAGLANMEPCNIVNVNVNVIKSLDEHFFARVARKYESEETELSFSISSYIIYLSYVLV